MFLFSFLGHLRTAPQAGVINFRSRGDVTLCMTQVSVKQGLITKIPQRTSELPF